MESVKNIQKMVETAKQDAIKLAKDLADMIVALKPLGIADTILNDAEFKKSIAVLGVSAPEPAPTTKAKPGKAGGKAKGRTPKHTDEEIIAFAGDSEANAKNTKAFVEKFNQLVPKRLKAFKTAGTLKMKKVGNAKFWWRP